MNNFEIIILALALVFNSWNWYMNAGLILSQEPIIRKIKFSALIFSLQFLMACTGIWLGFKVGSFEMQTNIIISLSIMLVVGLKVLLTGFRGQETESPKDFTDYKTASFMALVEGIVPLFIGISIGLLSTTPYLHCLLIGLFLLTGIFAGRVCTKQYGKLSFKIKLNTVAGLLFLSAALKLALNITRI